jgi:HK97 family phage prohead protease
MERLTFPFEIKAENVTDEGIFEGYGSVFNKIDSYRDTVLPGAFSKTLKKRSAKHIRMLWQHWSDTPVGKYLKIREDDHGLAVEGKLLLEIEKARDAHVLLKEEAIGGLSIGFNTKKFERDNDTGVRKLLEIDLWEISLVTFPADTHAKITGVKDINNKRDMENYLREAGFSRSDAKYMASKHSFQREVGWGSVLNDLKLLNLQIGA